MPAIMRLLMVSANHFPVMGGVEMHLREVTPRLAAAGVEVEVLTTDRTGRLPRLEQQEGVLIRRVAAWPRTRDYYIAPGILRHMAKGSWDIVHVHSYQTAVPPLAMLGAIRDRVPFVLSFHSGGHASSMRNRLRRSQQMALRPLVGRARRLIAVSPFEVRLFARSMKLPLDRFVTIPNGADMPQPSPGVGPSQESPLILSVGRLESYKGHQRAIRAFPHLLSEIPAARLRIVGTGPYAGQLHGLVDDMGLRAAVTVGSLPPGERQAMADLVASASLVVLFSEYEANPVAVMEALALRRPVLAAHTSGLADLADQGLISTIPLAASPVETARAMVDAVRRPIASPPVSLQTWDSCAADLLAVYRDVLARA